MTATSQFNVVGVFVCVHGVFNRRRPLPWFTPPQPALQMDLLQRGRPLPPLALLAGYIALSQPKWGHELTKATARRRLQMIRGMGFGSEKSLLYGIKATGNATGFICGFTRFYLFMFFVFVLKTKCLTVSDVVTDGLLNYAFLSRSRKEENFYCISQSHKEPR